MKTYNYDIDLMTPMQANKDIIFNEALLRIDSFGNNSVIGFVNALPQHPIIGEKYILNTADKYAGNICYCVDENKGWQLLQVRPGMVLFVAKENSFFIFENNKQWVKLSVNANMAITTDQVAQKVSTFPGSNATQENISFIGIENKFVIESSLGAFIYLYLNKDCSIIVDKAALLKTTVILKQNYKNAFNIKWSDNILWQQKHPHQITTVANSMDIVTLHALPETQHLLGAVIGQDYRF